MLVEAEARKKADCYGALGAMERRVGFWGQRGAVGGGAVTESDFSLERLWEGVHRTQ